MRDKIEELFKNTDNKEHLELIFELQKAFDDDLIERRSLQSIPKEEWIQKETLAMLSELSELIAEVNFKWWKNPKPVDDRRVKEELVDILHFFVSMCLKMGMTAEELCNMYVEKNRENFNRQYGLSAKQGYALDDAEKQDQ